MCPDWRPIITKICIWTTTGETFQTAQASGPRASDEDEDEDEEGWAAMKMMQTDSESEGRW